jgi:hypothetical protein
VRGIGKRLEDPGGLADLVGHTDHRDLGLAAVVRDARDDRLLHRISFSAKRVRRTRLWQVHDPGAFTL